MTRSDRHRTSRQPALLGFCPLQRLSNSRSPVLSGLPRPTPSVFRVSHPHDGFLPLEPTGRFSDRNALGVFPSGLLPPAEPSNPFGLGPLRGVGPTGQNRLRSPTADASPSRLCSLQGFATVNGGVSHRRTAAALLVFLPSREFLPAAARSLRRGSPHELHPCHELQNRGPKAMEQMSLQGFDDGRTGLPLARLPPLLGFLHLLPQRSVWDPAMPGL